MGRNRNHSQKIASSTSVAAPIKTTEIRIGWIVGALALALALSIYPLLLGTRYMMIGWNTCSRLDQAPLLFECHPGAGDPEMLELCTGREMGIAIASTREWLQHGLDCDMPRLFGGSRLKQAEQDETTEESADVAETEGEA